MLKVSNRRSSYTGAVIGGIIGLIGSILQSQLQTMNSDPLFIFALIGQILKFIGVFGCNWKTSYCALEDLVGYIITIAFLALVGSFIGRKFGKFKESRS